MTMHTKEEKLQAFGRLLDIIDELREKCPWDHKQTNESLRSNTIEEVYELCDALTRQADGEICKELGDVLAMDYKRQERAVDSATKLKVTMVRNGGFAAVLEVE